MFFYIFSYDVETLNQKISYIENVDFINEFSMHTQNKVKYGVQKLYLIGNVIFFFLHI